MPQPDPAHLGHARRLAVRVLLALARRVAGAGSPARVEPPRPDPPRAA